MQALFIGQAYIDITFVTDVMPTGDEKTVARDYAVSFGGNAVTAAFCCAKFGVKPDLLASVADDWLGRMFIDMAARYGISVHHRKVAQSSLSFVMPKDGQRAIVRCRDDDYKHPHPPLASHRLPRACMSTGTSPTPPSTTPAPAARPASLPRSTAAGCARTPMSSSSSSMSRWSPSGSASRWQLSPNDMLQYLRSRGCRIGGVTLGPHGMVYYQDDGEPRLLPALDVPPERVVDTNGAGDIFHGAYIYSFLSNPFGLWDDHFRFARAASAYAIQHLGNEASLPSLSDINETHARFDERRERPRLRVAC